jgi:hypothetical protein
MYLINVRDNSLLGQCHLTQLHAGLYDLAAANQIKLKFSKKLTSHPLYSHSNLLWLEAKNLEDGRTRIIGFDMSDHCHPVSEKAVNQSDVYFKRSFSKEGLENIDSRLKAKIVPYGLNYACNSKHEIRIKKYLQLFLSIINEPYHKFQPILRRVLSGKVSPFSEEFEVKASEVAEKKILFITRAWPQRDAAAAGKSWRNLKSKNTKWKDLNDSRADTIRALRDRFREDFIGGLIRTEFSERYYPDCICPYKTDKKNYLRLVKKCLVVVTTKGLWDSNGWKLAEYVAASRCIVTEPLHHELPVPLKEGENILLFNSPSHCVETCETLLNDSSLANRMRKNNEEYYQSQLKPSVLVLNRLKIAFES